MVITAEEFAVDKRRRQLTCVAAAGTADGNDGVEYELGAAPLVVIVATMDDKLCLSRRPGSLMRKSQYV
ncbi:MAG: hypothetical protein FD130_1216 [Halothiobacillaceae bacterium]|nr:MAG: hypothetical protein FD130_1216 [Halothiobacillaceae bacterium]